MSFSKVEDILKNTIKNVSLEKTFKVYPITKRWEEVVGSHIASKTQPDMVMGDTLVVSVVNSAWMNELQMQKKMILDKLEILGLAPEVKNIRFRILK